MPPTGDFLRNRPCGDLFGWTEDVGQGWDPGDFGKKQFLILSMAGGICDADGKLAGRPLRPDLSPLADLPQDTRLWAPLQQVSGGTWGGGVYDVDTIVSVLNAGKKALSSRRS